MSFDADKVTIGDYLTHWLGGLGESPRPTTRRRYTDLLQQHVIPHVGHVARRN